MLIYWALLKYLKKKSKIKILQAKRGDFFMAHTKDISFRQ